MMCESFERHTKTIPCFDKFHGGKKASLFEHPYILQLSHAAFLVGHKKKALKYSVKGPLKDRKNGLTVSA